MAARDQDCGWRLLILVFNGGSMNKVKFLSATPVVNVGDFEAALDFYKGALGFTVIFQLGRYAGLKLGDAASKR